MAGSIRQCVRIAVTAAVATLTAVATAAPAGRPSVVIVEPPEEDVRILEVVLDQAVLTDDLVAFAGPAGGTLLPLQATSELLAIAVASNPADALATGFILEERRTFHLDVGLGQVTIAGKTRAVDPALVRVQKDDIYVDSALLSEWLPVVFDLDLFALRLRVRPREPLPLQLRLERERRIRHWRLQVAPVDPGYPRVATPYHLWEAPSIDQMVRVAVAGPSTTASFATYATGDLLYMSSETYLAGTGGDLLDTARLTLRRRSPDGRIGGVLRATEVAIGHVVHPASGLLSTTSDPLPGFVLSNLPLNRPLEFDRHAFRGNLPAGWDVELYHNGSLIDHQRSRADGQYVFDQVPLLFGMNFFRLVFYGPHGQRREEHHRFLLGDSLTLPGRFEYRVTGNLDSATSRRLSVFASYGLNSHLTATAEAAVLPTTSGERRFGKFGLRAFWAAAFAYADVATDSRGHLAWEGGVQTRIFGTNVLAAREGAQQPFVSQIFLETGDPLMSRDRLRVDGAIPATLLPRIPLTLEIERRRFASGKTRTVAQSRSSVHYKGLSLTNRAVWTMVPNHPSELEGGLQVSRYARGLGLRGEILYAVDTLDLTAANLTVEKDLRSGYRLHASISRSFRGSFDVYTVGIDKTAGSYAAGVNATRDARGEVGANVDVSAGFGRDPRADRWVPHARSRAGFGAVSARVFLDRNENDIFDAGDELLPSVGFIVNSAPAPARTGNSGVALLGELAPDQPVDIAVDSRTLEDPQWLPQQRGVRVVTRAGKAIPIDLPVVTTAEIEGTVHAGRRVARGMAGAAIELVNAKGEVVQRTSTAYDGFYVLTHVRRGAYVVRVGARPEHLLVATRERPLERAVTIMEGTVVVTGVDFLVAPEVPRDVPRTTVAEAAPSHGTRDRRVVQVASLGITASDAGARDFDSGEDARAAITAAEGTFFVQLGAFTVAGNARALARSVNASSDGLRAEVDLRNRLHFVQVGPFPDRRAAAAAREDLQRAGFSGIIRQIPRR